MNRQLQARRLFGAVLILISVLISGCSAFDLVRPEVSLADIRLADVSLLETTVVLTLRIVNGNSFPLSLEGAVYDLSIDGQRVGRGSSSAPLDVPRLSSATHDITLHLRNSEVLRALRNALSGGGVDYRIEARHWVDTPLGRRAIDTVGQGRFGPG
ncbi:MAG TPA: LEA type 2 family protein [Thermoanaerobaculia bacterium]|nr:LEA type 2 family protein [Thermoanaerobaculia bacterium]